MSSKRNHRIRSRKSYRNRMYAARCALRGSMPWETRQALRAAAKPVEKNEIEAEGTVE